MESPSYHHQRFPGNCQLEFERCHSLHALSVHGTRDAHGDMIMMRVSAQSATHHDGDRSSCDLPSTFFQFPRVRHGGPLQATPSPQGYPYPTGWHRLAETLPLHTPADTARHTEG